MRCKTGTSNPCHVPQTPAQPLRLILLLGSPPQARQLSHSSTSVKSPSLASRSAGAPSSRRSSLARALCTATRRSARMKRRSSSLGREARNSATFTLLSRAMAPN
eukprot:scaffold111_cov404-Prasinococcus_capsulatus_cf.AAC.17